MNREDLLVQKQRLWGEPEVPKSPRIGGFRGLINFKHEHRRLACTKAATLGGTGSSKFSRIGGFRGLINLKHEHRRLDL